MIFIDTSAFYAMEVQTDVNHDTASLLKADIAKNRYGLLCTTNYVINEALTLFRFKVGHKEAAAFGDKVIKSKSLKIIRIDEAIEDCAWDIFKNHADKELSFTDCTSFVVMKEL
ncbi:MAG: PIN domain-containing protein, partial [Candidatus Hydrothermarchaeaceae archaeon]